MLNLITKLFKRKKSNVDKYDTPYEVTHANIKHKYLLRVIPNRLSSNGEIIIPKHFVNEEDRVEVFIKPKEGYSFTHITVKQMSMIGRMIDYSLEVDGINGKIVFTMPNTDVAVSTNFVRR